jgi:hypothetical protein
LSYFAVLSSELFLCFFMMFQILVQQLIPFPIQLLGQKNPSLVSFRSGFVPKKQLNHQLENFFSIFFPAH